MGGSPSLPVPPPPPEPAALASPGWDYATWGQRVLGYIVDSLLVFAVFAVGILIFALLAGAASVMAHAMRPWGGGAHGTGICCTISLFPLAGLLVGLWNKVYLVSERGASVGQGMMDIMVVNAQGQKVSTTTAFIRLISHTAMSFVPFLGFIDLLWPLWDLRRQTLHDKIADTYVVNRPGVVR